MNFVARKLGDIAKEVREVVLPDSAAAAKLPFLGLDQIEAGSGRIITYESNSSEGKSNTFAFDATHVLYGKLRPYLNKVALPDRLGRCSTEIIPLLPCGVDRDYLSYLLRTESVISAVMAEKTGSRMPRADMNVLMEIEVSVPKTESDQRRIVVHLNCEMSEVERARHAAEIQLNDVRILQAQVLEMLFGEIDAIPKKKIGDEAETCSGSTPTRSLKAYWEPAEVPWVKTAEVAFDPITQTEESVSRKALEECSLKVLPPRTVLVAMYGQGKTRGQSAILEIEATTNQACFAILPNDTWEPEFLYLWLMRSYQSLRTLSDDRGGNQANLNGALLNQFEVPAPSRSDQRAIVSKARAVLTEAETLANATKMAVEELNKLPERILAAAFET